MKKSITISIPEPCHEDWGKMTPTEKGKFCGVCTKEVFDFTQKSDEELVKILSNSKNTCGRFKKKQLNREVKLERKSGVHLAPYAASLLIPFTMINTVGASSSNDSLSEKTYTSLGIGSYSDLDRIQIITTGKITDENGKQLFNVAITVKETGKSEVSGLRGDYSIKSLDHETLVFKKDGFMIQEVVMGLQSTEMDIKMVPEVVEQMLVGEIALPEEPSEEMMGDIIEIETPAILKGKVVSEKTVTETKKDSSIVIIKGNVSDDVGLPLPGVNVIVKGTTIGTQTDFDGNYSLNAKANQQLVFSYIGFTTQAITVANVSNRIDVQMEASEVILGGLVMVRGMISVKKTQFVQSFPKQSFKYDAEREAAKEEQQKAYDNQIEYKRIKQARKKAQRKLNKAKTTTLCRLPLKKA